MQRIWIAILLSSGDSVSFLMNEMVLSALDMLPAMYFCIRATMNNVSFMTIHSLSLINHPQYRCRIIDLEVETRPKEA